MIEVVLPVLDEATAIPHVLTRFRDPFVPLVVDNGSRDGSGEIARELGVRVITEHRRGFGAACAAGLRAASTDLVCFMDCDGSLDPAELERVVAPVRDGDVDLCLGAREPHAGAWPLHARIANRALAFELRRRTELELTDLGPMRCMARTSLLDLGIADRGSGWPLEMVLRAAGAGCRVGEVPVGYLSRVGGRSKVSGSVVGTIRAVRDMRTAFATVT